MKLYIVITDLQYFFTFICLERPSMFLTQVCRVCGGFFSLRSNDAGCDANYVDKILKRLKNRYFNDSMTLIASVPFERKE